MEGIRIETSVRHRRNVPILDVTGEVDIYTTPQFKQALAAVIQEGATSIIVNMARVNYLDSSGFGALLSATKRLRPLSGNLYIVGCNDAIMRMLHITRLNTIFGVFDHEDDAIAAIEAVNENVLATADLVASGRV